MTKNTCQCHTEVMDVIERYLRRHGGSIRQLVGRLKERGYNVHNLSYDVPHYTIEGINHRLRDGRHHIQVAIAVFDRDITARSTCAVSLDPLPDERPRLIILILKKLARFLYPAA